jgi:uncharacterized phage-associated protein
MLSSGVAGFGKNVLPYDVRAVANFVLDRSERAGVGLTNLAINKVLYFVHGNFFAHASRSLIREQPEAWEFGPVYREIYRQFRGFEKKPIATRAKRLDPLSGTMVTFDFEFPHEDLRLAIPIVDFYIRIPVWKLVELSHIPGGPWHQIWNHSSLSNPGMTIPDNLIESYFKSKPPSEGVFRG